jgi:hypothetical protein
MSERLIPISKKQHDSFNNIAAGIRAAERDLTTAANTILQGVDEDIGQVNVTGVRCDNGVYSLVLTLPDIAPAVEKAESA